MIWQQEIIDFKGQKVEYGKGVPLEPKGIVVVVHGFAEHMGRYSELISFLQNEGYGVYAINHLGHGGSGETRGHVKDFFDMVDSVNKLVELAKKENKNIFMLGHSMGGLISAAYGIRYPNVLKGQIFSAPALGVKLPKLVQFFLKVGRLIIPKKTVENKVANEISKDAKVVEDYLNDEKVLKSATINFYYEVFLKGTAFVSKRIKEYNYPFLIMHGTEDKIIDYRLSEKFYKEAASADKEIKIYQGLYHEILNEPEKEMAKADILQWLEDKSYKKTN